MVVWKSMARQAAAAMNVTRLITPKSTVIPAGRATNLLQRRGFANGRDHHGPPKDEFWGLGKKDVKYICIGVGGLMILNQHYKHQIKVYKELFKVYEELTKELKELNKELGELLKELSQELEEYKKKEEKAEVFN